MAVGLFAKRPVRRKSSLRKIITVMNYGAKFISKQVLRREHGRVKLLSSVKEIMIDRPTNRQTDMRGHREVFDPLGGHIHT